MQRTCSSVDEPREENCLTFVFGSDYFDIDSSWFVGTVWDLKLCSQVWIPNLAAPTFQHHGQERQTGGSGLVKGQERSKSSTRDLVSIYPVMLISRTTLQKDTKVEL